jgi:uncharacterized protein (DUF1499 family)
MEKIIRPFVNNEVSTDEPGWYPEIEPQRYEVSADEVFEAARESIRARERWETVEADGEARRLEVEVTTEMMDFVDDLVVEVEERDGGAVVHAESQSRVGEGDLGQNAQTVREFFDRLDDRVLA